ncbi:MAG: hypothetical protein K0S11_1586 [Gammaproteobacteria bacterium]|jgi:segregation and condensation protein B|nr:hypothetical protein [Gammaproteobacteria bacterium]
MEKLSCILEAALLVAAQPLSIDKMRNLFTESERPTVQQISQALQMLAENCLHRGIELKEVASGYCFQTKSEYSQWVQRLWEEKPAKYSRTLLEILALVAYRQPITRAEIEAIRGVAVNAAIIKTLQEREWIKVIGYKDVPGKPGLYATTKQFLDYFNLRSIDELPTLVEMQSVNDFTTAAAHISGQTDTLNYKLELEPQGV